LTCSADFDLKIGYWWMGRLDQSALFGIPKRIKHLRVAIGFVTFTKQFTMEKKPYKMLFFGGGRIPKYSFSYPPR